MCREEEKLVRGSRTEGKEILILDARGLGGVLLKTKVEIEEDTIIEFKAAVTKVKTPARAL